MPFPVTDTGRFLVIAGHLGQVGFLLVTFQLTTSICHKSSYFRMMSDDPEVGWSHREFSESEIGTVFSDQTACVVKFLDTFVLKNLRFTTSPVFNLSPGKWYNYSFRRLRSQWAHTCQDRPLNSFKIGSKAHHASTRLWKASVLTLIWV